MLGPLRLRISALPMRRLSSDSAMTASGMDLYHSSGVNWDGSRPLGCGHLG